MRKGEKGYYFFAKSKINFIFSHPDSTVGQGISPCRDREAALADYTAGMELHHSSKTFGIVIF